MVQVSGGQIILSFFYIQILFYTIFDFFFFFWHIDIGVAKRSRGASILLSFPFDYHWSKYGPIIFCYNWIFLHSIPDVKPHVCNIIIIYSLSYHNGHIYSSYLLEPIQFLILLTILSDIL